MPGPRKPVSNLNRNASGNLIGNGESASVKPSYPFKNPNYSPFSRINASSNASSTAALTQSNSSNSSNSASNTASNAGTASNGGSVTLITSTNANTASSTPVSTAKRPRAFKTLKQIISSEKPQPGTGITYLSIDAPSSRRLVEKYSDLSGLPARYRDPSTTLLYYNCEEYAQIKMLTQDIINGYLELRKANA